MPAWSGPKKGRTIVVKRGTAASEVAIAGVRTKSVKMNGEPIDVTDDDSVGWRTLLEDVAEVSVDISVSGIAKNDTLRTESLVAGDRVQSMVFLYDDGAKISGLFHLANYQETGEYQDVITFEAEFQSAGAITYTPAA